MSSLGARLSLRRSLGACCPAPTVAPVARRRVSTSAVAAKPDSRSPAPIGAPLPPLDFLGQPAPAASTSALKPTKKLAKPRASTRKPKKEASSTLSESPLSSLEQTIRRDLARYPDALLLTQVGSFFESYFDQAPIVARILGIKLTSKSWGKGAVKYRAAFCGFPLGQLQKHLTTLVEAGNKVVVVEEVAEKTAEEDGLVDGGDKPKKEPSERRVTRIVSPGTGIDDGFVQQDKMNFALAVGVSSPSLALPKSSKSKAAPPPTISLAYRDISTGSAFTRTSTLSTLRDDIFLIEPREVIVDTSLPSTSLGTEILALLESEAAREKWIISTTSSASPEAEEVLNSYLSSMLLESLPPRNEAVFVDPDKILQMDSTTLKSLEIRESLRGGVKGTLLSAVRRTATPGGARLLLHRLCAPSTQLTEIQHRHSLVSAFLSLPTLRPYLLKLLKTFDDTSRLLQRLSMKRSGAAFDLLGLRKTLIGVSDVRHALSDHLSELEAEHSEALGALLARLTEHDALAKSIGEAIDEEALMIRTSAMEKRAAIEENLGASGAEKELEDEETGWRYTEGLWGKNEEWVVRPVFSPALSSLHRELTVLRTKAFELEKSLRKKYRYDGVVLKAVAKQGPVLHVPTKSDSAVDKDEKAVLVSKSGSTRNYSLAAWSALYSQIERQNGKIRRLEDQNIKNLTAKVMERYGTLQQMVAALDELDVSLGFAQVALERTWVRPIVNDGTDLKIIAGRHPTVEQALSQTGRTFASNSLEFSHPSAFVHCLTGPNMAGKSTFLRQNALIVVLAQAGSFVPAESATVGIVDRVFSRVGARDELDRDRSTFMIEMDEAAGIMHSATERSLVLLDELGRGTSPLDGLAIAYAALEHLVQVNRSRTLFATHYHKLGKLIQHDPNDVNSTQGKEWEGLEFWCTDLNVVEGMVHYSHTIRRGLNDDSAGLVIARLAGLPERMLNVAEKVKRWQAPE